MFDPADPDVRERLAALAYYRERADDAAADREFELEDATYLALSWESLGDDTRRPYRSAVACCCDEFVRAAA